MMMMVVWWMRALRSVLKGCVQRNLSVCAMIARKYKKSISTKSSAQLYTDSG
jgi:hypothetical protein